MTKIVGILNVTSNSFSEKKHYNTTDLALQRYHELIKEGADYVDIGAEATSYGAIPLTWEEEWKSLESLLNQIENKDSVSIDTYHPQTAKKAIELGYSFINDVAGGKMEGMLDLIGSNKHVKYVLMHNLVIPADRNFRIKNVEEMYTWAKANIKKCLDAGIEEERLIFDPGLGFTTFPKEGFEIIKNCEKLKELGVASYIGHSRKSIFEDMTSLPPSERDIETVICSIYMKGKVDYLRVHNVQMHKRAFKAWESF